MILFFANNDYCRKHLSLEDEGETGKNRFDCPAKRAGLIDRIWSLGELLLRVQESLNAYKAASTKRIAATNQIWPFNDSSTLSKFSDSQNSNL
jgi:hypothetical protein